MDVPLTPALQAQLDHIAAETGRTPEELVEEAVAVYLHELTQLQALLDGDRMRSGRLADLTQARARLQEQGLRRRRQRGG